MMLKLHNKKATKAPRVFLCAVKRFREEIPICVNNRRNFFSHSLVILHFDHVWQQQLPTLSARSPTEITHYVYVPGNGRRIHELR